MTILGVESRVGYGVIKVWDDITGRWFGYGGGFFGQLRMRPHFQLYWHTNRPGGPVLFTGRGGLMAILGVHGIFLSATSTGLPVKPVVAGSGRAI